MGFSILPLFRRQLPIWCVLITLVVTWAALGSLFLVLNQESLHTRRSSFFPASWASQEFQGCWGAYDNLKAAMHLPSHAGFGYRSGESGQIYLSKFWESARLNCWLRRGALKCTARTARSQATKYRTYCCRAFPRRVQEKGSMECRRLYLPFSAMSQVAWRLPNLQSLLCHLSPKTCWLF